MSLVESCDVTVDLVVHVISPHPLMRALIRFFCLLQCRENIFSSLRGLPSPVCHTFYILKNTIFDHYYEIIIRLHHSIHI